MKTVDAFGKLHTIAALVDKSKREGLAKKLAQFYHADSMTIFLKDKEVGLFLPAAGLPQKLKNARSWQGFFARCETHGRAHDRLQLVDWPGPKPVLGVCCDADAILILVGAGASIEDNDELLVMLPVLAWAFDKERQASISAENAASAKEKEMTASMLSEALGKVRAKLASALVEAQHAQAALRLADQRKDEFLAILAHELRNPLAPIGNGIELLKFAEEDPKMLPGIRKMMDNQLRQMARLIDDLMDVSRITRGKVTLQFQRVPLRQIIDSAIEGVKPVIDRQHHTLIVDFSDDDIVLNADAARLSQVFSNLLSNAAKYTDPGGRIELTIGASQNEVTVRVKDSGVGLDSAEVDNIFGMFVQVNRTSTDVRGGLGIGLTLVKRLVESHGGKVTAKSAGHGCGSEFIVTLPRAIVGEAPDKQPSIPSRDEGPKKPLSFLVVDDNEASAKSMGTIVEMLGHKTEIAFNGRGALTKARACRPDIILLDIGLPDISGYEVSRRLRQERVFDRTLIVAQTGWGQESHKRQGREAGFDHYLVKPLDIGQLQNIIALAQAAS